MPETTPKALLCRRIVQLLVTEGLSFCFFLSARSRLGQALAVRLGLTAAISLVLFPLWALEDGDYVGFLGTLLLNMAFAVAIVLSVIKSRRWVGGISLFVFNLTSLILSLNY